MSSPTAVSLPAVSPSTDSRPAPSRSGTRTSHIVQFYENERSLARHVSEFLSGTLATGGRAVVIATVDHWDLFRATLGGPDVTGPLETNGRLAWLDAVAVLDRLLVNGRPDRARFEGVLASITDMQGPGRLVAYGEMVDLLWQSGRAEAALQLEEIWNEALSTRDIQLLCAYAMHGFADSDQAAPFRLVCDCHDHVKPAELETRSPDLLAREIAVLQQQAWALQSELRHRMRLEDALRNADRRKDRFIATLAHELRNPLAPLQNAVQILRAVRPDGAEFATDVVERQVRLMSRLVDDLLDLSRMTTGRIELRRRRVAVRDILHDALETSRPLIDSAGQELVVAMPPASLDIDADPARLAQVIANLLNNAAKYTDRGGRIVLKAEHSGAELRISVSDTGIGIPQHKLDQVFEIFTQLDEARDRAQGGLGIGLAVAKQLVEMHGGRIVAASGGRGAGSTFRITLPMLDSGGSPGPDSGQPSSPSSPGLRVLIVDDNLDSASTMAMFLQITGHNVRVAHDGMEAVAAAKEFRPDVVLMDIGLPGMNGHEAGRAIRAESWASQTVLIALSGWGQEADKQRSREAGFNHHLVKPVDHAMLVQILNQAGALRDLRRTET